MPAIKHVHTYVRYKARPNWYRCAAPNCTHHIDKEVLLGKLSLCTSCGTEFILSREDLRRAKPKCLNCSNTKKAKLHQKVASVMDIAYLGTEHFDPLKLLKMQDDQGRLFATEKTSTSQPEDDLESESDEEEFDEFDEDVFDDEGEEDSEEEESEDSET